MHLIIRSIQLIVMLIVMNPNTIRIAPFTYYISIKQQTKNEQKLKKQSIKINKKQFKKN